MGKGNPLISKITSVANRVNRFNNSRLWLFHCSPVMLDAKLDPIISYLKESSMMIEQKENEIEQNYKNLKESVAQNGKGDNPYDHYISEVLHHKEFPELLNTSMLFVIYSLFESHYKELCGILQNHLEYTISLDDLQGGNYIQKGQHYLTKVIEIDHSPLNRLWEKITYYQKVRNALTHNRGKYNKDNNSGMKRFISDTPGIILENKKIRIKEISFLESFIQIIKDYFSALNTILARRIIVDQNESHH